MERSKVLLLLLIYLLGIITGYSINEAYYEKIKYEKENKDLENKTINVSNTNISAIEILYNGQR